MTPHELDGNIYLVILTAHVQSKTVHEGVVVVFVLCLIQYCHMFLGGDVLFNIGFQARKGDRTRKDLAWRQEKYLSFMTSDVVVENWHVIKLCIVKATCGGHAPEHVFTESMDAG